MAKPLVTFPDPEALVKAYLEAAWVGREEPYRPATIETGFPPVALTKTPLRTHVQIEAEPADVARFPVVEDAQVRVNCWVPKGERGAAKALAGLTHGLLLTHTDIRPQIGRSEVIKDPTTGYLMVWFAVTVSLRAAQLA